MVRWAAGVAAIYWLVGCSPVADGDYREALECSAALKGTSTAIGEMGDREFETQLAALAEGFEQRAAAEGTKLGKTIPEINEDRKATYQEMIRLSQEADTEPEMRELLRTTMERARECVSAY